MPNSDKGEFGYDICSWYAQWPGRNPKVKVITHDIVGIPSLRLANLSVEYFPEPNIRLANCKQLFSFSSWAISALFVVFIGLLRGRWWNALMFSEAARMKVVSLAHEETLAQDYLFHFSSSIYRPMWTYAAEAKGARIICYFYSTYTQPQLREKEESQISEWGPSTWPVLLVWNSYQADTLMRDLGPNAPVRIVGPIYFSDMESIIPTLPERPVAVFDIQPHRKHTAVGISTLYEYYYFNKDVHRLFLEDIYDVLHSVDMSLVLKAKRLIGGNMERCYGNFLARLDSYKDVTILNSEIAAPRLMLACIGAISAPFTSTALYFKEYGYHSVYYDPTGLLRKDDPAAHGIPILTSKSELKFWVETLSLSRRAIEWGIK